MCFTKFVKQSYWNNNRLRPLSLFTRLSICPAPSYFGWLEWPRHFWNLAEGGWIKDMFSWRLVVCIYVVGSHFWTVVVITSHPSAGIASRNIPTAHCGDSPGIVIWGAVLWVYLGMNLSYGIGHWTCGQWRRNKGWNIGIYRLVWKVLPDLAGKLKRGTLNLTVVLQL